VASPRRSVKGGGIALAGNTMTERIVVFLIVAVLALLIVAEWIAVLTQPW
jgi:hypothetical protein